MSTIPRVIRLRSVVLTVTALAALSSSAASWKLKATADGGAAAKGLNNNTWASMEDESVESTTVNANDDYFVLANTLYSGSGDQLVFQGKSLTLGDVATSQSGTFLHYYGKGISGDKDLTLSGDGLILAKGKWMTKYGTATQPYRAYSKVTVAATESSPFQLTRDGANENTLEINGPFCGNGWVSVEGGNSPIHTLALLGGYDDFSGGIRLDATVSEGVVSKCGRLLVPAGNSLATVRAASGARIATTNLNVTAGFGTFELADGAVLEFQAKGTGTTEATRVLTNSKYALSSGLTAAGKVKVEVAFADSANGKFNDAFDLLTVPASADLDEDDFTFVPTDANHPEASFSVRNDGVTKTLVLTYVGTGADLLLQAEAGTNAKGLTGVKWSDGSTGTSGDYNYATIGYSIYISSATSDDINAFSGNSLRIGDALTGTAGYLRHYGGKPAVTGHRIPDFPNDGIILACGAWAPRYGQNYLVSGKVKVTAPASAPFRFYNEYVADAGGTAVHGSLTLLGPLSGSGTLQVDAGVINHASSTNFSLRLMGGAADFTGTIAVTSQVSSTLFDCHAGLLVTNGTLPGVVKIGRGSYLCGPFAGETTTIKSLAFDDGGELISQAGLVGAVNRAGTIAVTDSFAASGIVSVSLSLADAYVAGGTLEILTFPAASAVSEENFALATDIPTFYTGQLSLSLRTDDGGETKTLVLTVPETVQVSLTGNDESLSQIVPPTTESSSFTNATNWSDQKVPHEGAHYLCQAKTSARTLRTPYELIDYTFPGLSLSLIGSTYEASLVILYNMFAVPKMLTRGTASILPKYSNGGVVLRTELTASDGTLTISAYAGGLFRHEGELKGAATVRAAGNGRGSSNPGGYVEFTGINTNFTGVFDIYTTPSDVRNVPSIGYGPYRQRYYESVYVSDGRNLGGAMSPANTKGIILRDCSMVITRNSVTFDEPTRGWYVGTAGQFNVEEAGHTFTLASPLAVDGTIYKRGDGCLTLANPQPTFGSDGTAATPDADDATKRTLIVTNGAVKIASACAVNGLDIVMDAPEAKLILDAETTDEALAANGFVDVLTPGAPLAVNADAGVEKVRVEIACDEMPIWSSKTLGICMVRQADASTVANLLDVRRCRGAKIRIARVVSEAVIVGSEQYVSFRAILKRPGFTLQVR